MTRTAVPIPQSFSSEPLQPENQTKVFSDKIVTKKKKQQLEQKVEWNEKE